MDRGAWQGTVHGVAKSQHDLVSEPPPTINQIGYDTCCNHTCWSFTNGSVVTLGPHWSLNACVFLRPRVLCGIGKVTAKSDIQELLNACQPISA